MFRKLAASLVLTALFASSALGQQWARKMFKATDHDFGTVARGAKIEFPFELSNLYLEDVHISSVRSSCTCTSPRIAAPVLETYQKGAIIAKFNTQSFTGHKSATITVTIDRPYYATVQLHVRGNIRGDVVIHPGSVKLGTVDQGTAVEQQANVSRTGYSNWKIVNVKSANPHISAELVEAARHGGRVAYDVKVRLAETAPAGYIRDHLMLVTNDSQGTQIPLLVEGQVTAPLSVSPASLFMGVVNPGQTVTKKLVVRGKKPFRILAITCDDASFAFEKVNNGDTAKPLHIVSVTFAAGETAGNVTKKIRIETDLDASIPELAACAVISQ